jgi:hypothetical protein
MEKNPNPIKNLMPQNKRFMGNEKFQQNREVSGWLRLEKCV